MRIYLYSVYIYVYTYTYQKAFLHTLFCLFLKTCAIEQLLQKCNINQIISLMALTFNGKLVYIEASVKATVQFGGCK